MRLIEDYSSVETLRFIDPSELLRPEPLFAKKPMDCYRNYSINHEDPLQERVRLTYLAMHSNQTMSFVKESMANWLSFSKFEATITDALIKLNALVDESDPDVDIPNIVHAFQTAERIRYDHPDLDWFQLTGLIHDLGKVMALYGEPQWAVVGDTFPVGCAFADSIVYRDTSFTTNPDLYDPRYNTKYGIYSPNCGLEKVTMSWGHDEYMYRVLLHNRTKLPQEALYAIRYHSFYPWHAGGDYMYLCNETDLKMLDWIREFNKYDLYTKSEDVPDVEELLPYYQKLVDKYIPGVLKW